MSLVNLSTFEMLSAMVRISGDVLRVLVPSLIISFRDGISVLKLQNVFRGHWSTHECICLQRP